MTAAALQICRERGRRGGLRCLGVGDGGGECSMPSRGGVSGLWALWDSFFANVRDVAKKKVVDGRCNEMSIRILSDERSCMRGPQMWRPGKRRLGLSGYLGAFHVGQGSLGVENGDRPVFRGTSSLWIGGGVEKTPSTNCRPVKSRAWFLLDSRVAKG